MVDTVLAVLFGLISAGFGWIAFRDATLKRIEQTLVQIRDVLIEIRDPPPPAPR